MLAQLKRHPIPISTHFEHSLVLTYALPKDVLEPLVPRGMSVDPYRQFGFVAVALVAVRNLRPSCLPAAVGSSYFLSGYRIFVRRRTAEGRLLRGLHILRSDTDSAFLKFGGNLLTHYRYQHSKIDWSATPSNFHVQIASPDGLADLDVSADLSSMPASLPTGSPFDGTNDSRRFAGPLPWTFDYEPETASIIGIRGHREIWKPTQVGADVRVCTFFDRPEFKSTTPVLANAFYVSDLPYRWERGVRTAAEFVA